MPPRIVKVTLSVQEDPKNEAVIRQARKRIADGLGGERVKTLNPFGISPAQLEQLQRQYSRIQQQFQAAQQLLDQRHQQRLAQLSQVGAQRLQQSAQNHGQRLTQIQQAGAQRLQQSAQAHNQRLAQIQASGANQVTAIQQRSQAAQAVLAQRHQQRLQQLAAARDSRLAQLEQQRATQLVAIQRRVEASEVRHTQRLREIRERESQRAKQSLSVFGGQVQSFGQQLSVGVTVPLLAAAAAATKVAIEFDKAKNTLTALESSSKIAELRLQQLRKLAQETPGLTTQTAISGFSQLRAIGGVSDETRLRSLRGLGRLNAVFGVDDPGQFLRNQVQIFTQSFERADIKEALGRVPIFEQILEQAFGTKDGKQLRKLKESGKLTLDSYLAGIATAIEQHPQLSKIQESLGGQLFKNLERIGTSLQPLGAVLLAVIVPGLAKLADAAEKASAVFQKLPAPVQIGVVALAALAAVAGPLLIGFGVLAASVTALIGFFAAFGKAILIATGVLAAVAASAGVFYVAWKTNFAGVRDITAQAVDFIKVGIGSVIAFIQQNGPLFLEAFKNIVKAATAVWQFFSGILAPVLRDAFNAVVVIIRGGAQQIGGLLKIVAQIITGRFSEAWETTKQLARNFWKFTLDLFASGVVLVVNMVKSLFGGLLKLTGLSGSVGAALGSSFSQALARTIVPGFGYLEKAYGAIKSRVAGASKVETKGAGNFAGDLLGGFSGQFNQTVESIQAEIEKLKKGFGDTFKNLGSGKTSGGGGARVLTELQQLQKQLAEAEKDLSSFLNTGSREFNLRIKLDDVRALKGQLEEIVKLRREAGLLADGALPKDARAAAGEVERLKALLETQKLAKNPQITIPLESQSLFRDMAAVTAQARELEEIVNDSNPVIADYVLNASLMSDRFKQLREQGGPLVTGLQELAKALKFIGEQDAAGEKLKNFEERLKGMREALDGLTEAQRLAKQIRESGLSPEDQQRLLGQLGEVEALESLKQQQERITEIGNHIRDTFRSAFADAFQRGPKAFFDRLAQAFKETLSRLAADLLSSAVFKLLFGQSPAGGGAPGVGGLLPSGAPAGGGGGGFLGNIFGGLLGGNRQGGGGGGLFGGIFGPGVTGGFAGPLGGSQGSGGGGILGALLGGARGGTGGGLRGVLNGALGFPLFGAGAGTPGATATIAGVRGVPIPGVNPALGPISGPGAAAAAPGALASLASGGLLLGGGLLGSLAGGKSPIGRLVGGIGGTLGAGFLGASGVFGSGVAAALPALLSNPITAVIAGALVGTAFLINKFSNTDLKSLRKLIKGEYGVDIKSNEPLKQIKEIGKAKFGKDQFPKKHLEAIRLEESKEIISAYAEATGQQARNLKLAKDLANPNNPANLFIKREFGGPVYPGIDYLVGERRPEVFRPSVPGVIIPSVPQAIATSRGDDADTRALMAATMEMIATLTARLTSMSPGHMLGLAAKQNPRAISGTVRSTQNSDASYSQGFLSDAGF